MKILIIVFLAISLFASTLAHAVVLPGLIDDAGKPVHTADEFTLQIMLNLTKIPQGYRYSYSLQSSPSSLQDVWALKIKLPAIDGVVLNSTSSPWGVGGYPKSVDPIRNKYFPNFTYTSEMLFVGWAIPPVKGDPRLLVPSGLLSGFTFTSPYPPSISFAYVEGLTGDPVFDVEPDSEDISLPFDKHTPYGPGKIIPVIGPVKPAVGAGGVASPYNNVAVQQCAGVSCTVQLTAAGPQDPYGTVYTYTWSGGFGTVPGINPTLQLPVGTNPVTLTVSDPYGTVLTTATMDVVVVNPNPTSGGNGQNGSGDMDHDGIPDDRDGDGKPNNQDNDPDHAD